MAKTKYVQEIMLVIFNLFFSDGRDYFPNIRLDTSLGQLCGRAQQPIHDALDDAKNVKYLCHTAANHLGFQSYVDYLNQHHNEMFQ